MGSPTISSENVWDVYRELLYRFEHLDDAVEFLEQCETYIQEQEIEESLHEEMPPAGEELLGGFEENTEDGYFYMGGVNNGRGLGKNSQSNLYHSQ